MEPVAVFPEGSIKLYARILDDVRRKEPEAVATPAREAVLAASRGASGRIAEGSFGKIYSLADAARPMVAKQVTPADARTACNAMKEGILLSVLSAAGQDYVPALHNCFLDQGSCYSVMDQASKSLDACLPVRGPAFDQSELGVLAVSLLAAVHGLHVAGLLHNDLKPKNLLLAGRPEAPTVQIVDLDAATLLGMAASGATTARNSNGTTAYLSPERLLTGNCSVQSDMWAVGIVIYELLEGRRKYPFNWQGRRMTAAMMEDRIGKLAARGVSLPSGLRAGPWGPLLQGLLHKDPTRRWGVRECACFPGFQDAFFLEAAARAAPTHAALIHQLLAMRKVWQAAAACWEHEGIRQSLCQEVNPLAAHMGSIGGAPLQQIGLCCADDDSDDGGEECGLGASGGADACSAACLGRLADSRTVSTIVFSSDDEDSDSDDSSSSTGCSSGCGNDTCDQDEPAAAGSVAVDGGSGAGRTERQPSAVLPTSCGGAAAAAAEGAAGEEPQKLLGSCSLHGGTGGGTAGEPLACLDSYAPSDVSSTVGVQARGPDKTRLLAAATCTTPRAATDDGTKSSFKIAAAWPPDDAVSNEGAPLAAPAVPSCQSVVLACGQLLDASAMAKMYIKSTLSEKPAPGAALVPQCT